MTYVYVGGYTDPDRNGRGKGIDVYRMDETTGDLTHLQTLAGVQNPHFLALHPNRRCLYSTNGGDASGGLVVRDRRGERAAERAEQPEVARRRPDPPGRRPERAAGRGRQLRRRQRGGLPDRGRRAAGARTRTSTSTTAQLGPNPKRQDKPHAHMAGFDPSGRCVLVCDLGMDRTFVYAVDASAAS